MWYNRHMNAQTEALQYSLTHELDNHAIACNMAKQRPALFVELAGVDLDKLAAAFLKAEPEYFLQLAKIQHARLERIDEIRTFMTAGNMIGAIKVLREIHGIGLKEAKDIIVAVRDKLQADGRLNLPPPPAGSPLATTAKLDASLIAIYNNLLEVF